MVVETDIIIRDIPGNSIIKSSRSSQLLGLLFFKI